MSLRIFIVLVLCWWWAVPAWAASSAAGIGDGLVLLDDQVVFLEDPLHKHDPVSLQDPELVWQRNGATAFNQGYSDSSWWLRVSLHNPHSTPQSRYLEIAYAALDHIDIHVTEKGQPVGEVVRMGDKRPYAERPLDHRFFVAPLRWDAGQTLDLYLHIRSSGALQAPLRLWTAEQFSGIEFRSSVVQGIYFGGMITIAIYNMLIFFVLRDRNYLYYVAFMVSTMMALAAQNGLAFAFLWPEATRWNDISIIFFAAGAGGFGALFTRRFLGVVEWSSRLEKWLRGFAALGLLLMALVFVIDYRVMVIVVIVTLALTVMLAVVAGSYAWWRGVPSARIYMLAWSMLMLGALEVLFSRLGLLPVTLITEYSAQIGSLLESILLSLALADRINIERKLRFQAQSEMLDSSRRANAELEGRVQQRTAELEQLNQRLQALSNTDQLTGLANRRALGERLEAEWARCFRHDHPLAVLLLDIDHFKRINDTHGHPAGDTCIRQVAGMINAGVRWPADIAARYGGEEFCLVLPETDAEGARAVAERIRASVDDTLITHEGLSFDVTLSIGVFVGLPRQEQSAEDFIRKADAALYRSKQEGRNRVTLVADV